MDIRINYYSINNIINFVVIDKKNSFNRLFDSFDIHYENFRIEKEPENIDLIIEIGHFKPNLTDCYEVGLGRLFFRKDWMYISAEKYKGAKWRFEVDGFEKEKTIVRIDCNSLGRIFITGYVIDFLIHLKLLRKGFPIIHASAVSKNDNGLILSSSGGGGKTTIAINMTTQDSNFLGDNYVMIHRGEIFAFPTSLSIFTYNLSPIILKALYRKERLFFKLKKWLEKITQGHVKIFTKINPNRVFQNMIEKSKFKYGFFLNRKSGSTNIYIIDKIDKSDFITRMIFNQKLEFNIFDKYINEYSYFFPDTSIASHWEKYGQSLSENLQGNGEYYDITLPDHYARDISQILEKMCYQ